MGVLSSERSGASAESQGDLFRICGSNSVILSTLTEASLTCRVPEVGLRR